MAKNGVFPTLKSLFSEAHAGLAHQNQESSWPFNNIVFLCNTLLTVLPIQTLWKCFLPICFYRTIRRDHFYARTKCINRELHFERENSRSSPELTTLIARSSIGPSGAPALVPKAFRGGRKSGGKAPNARSLKLGQGLLNGTEFPPKYFQLRADLCTEWDKIWKAKSTVRGKRTINRSKKQYI